MKKNVVAALLVLASACGGAVKSGTGPKAPVAAAPVVVKKDIVEYVPADSAIVMRFDLHRLLESSIWKRYASPLTSSPDFVKVLSVLDDGCGLDLMRDLRELVIAMPASGDDTRFTVLLHGKFDTAQFEKCVIVASQELGHDHVDVKTQAGVTAMTDSNGKTLYFGWAAPDVVVINGASAQGDRAALDWVGKPIVRSPGRAALHVELDADQLFAGYVVIEDKLAADMTTMGEVRPESLWLNLTQNVGMGIELGMRYPTPMQAQKAGALVRDQVHQMGSGDTARLVDKLRVEARGRDVIIDWQLDPRQLNEILQALDMFIPMMIGGMNVGLSTPDDSDVEGGLEGGPADGEDREGQLGESGHEGGDDLQEYADKARIRSMVDKHSDELVACYHKARAKEPGLAGTLMINFTVEADGKVTNVFTEGMDSKTLKTCAEDVVGHIHFEAPQGQRSVTMLYPFTFQP